jgi:penicillin-binding protein 1C
VFCFLITFFQTIRRYAARALSHRWIRRVVWSSGISAALFGVLWLLFPLPPLKPYSVVISDRNGEFLHAFLAEDGIWRLRTPPDEIPPKLKTILLQKEDRFFYWHFGINPFAVARAFVQNLTTGRRVSGASTITMQVARMLERKERTYFNKLIEMFRAVQLECCYSKDEILELYLSLIPVGGNLEGLKSASLVYYQTPLERLNTAQLLDLTLIPNNPNRLRPDRNPDALYRERLERAVPLIESGVFTAQDSTVIWQTSVSAVRKELPRLAPHLARRLKQDLKSKSAQGVMKTERLSSLDLRLQTVAEQLVQNHLRVWKTKGVTNGAAVILDNRTHEVLAYIGSENFYDKFAQGEVDAITAVRSPGSTLKPFLYALQMERGELTPKRRLLDVPFDDDGFTAENYDGGYSGFVFADDALRRSLNIPMIHLLREAGFDNFLSFLSQLGFETITSQKANLGVSLILGGCGVTLEELVAAYSIFPNSGVYVKPSLEKHSSAEKHKAAETPDEIGVCSASSAFMVTEILSGLNRPDLPNNFESAINLPKVAFKTGTSYGRRDAWAIGYSHEFTIGVWTGNMSGKGSAELVGSKTAAPLVIDLFNALSAPHQKIILPKPADVRQREVCAGSGRLPGKNCTYKIFDWYSLSKTLNRPCDLEQDVWVSPDTARSYCASCLGTNAFITLPYPDYPPELVSFWTSRSVLFQKPPPHNASCTRIFSGAGPKIVSPQHEMTYYLTSLKQKLVLQAASGVDVDEHVWYLDDKLLEKKRAGEKLFLSINGGTHSVACMDNKGRRTTIKIIVKEAL